MINSLKQHEKTFRKFVEWMLKKNYRMRNGIFLDYKRRTDITDRELLSLLVEFCREQNYWIESNLGNKSEYEATDIIELCITAFVLKFVNKNEYTLVLWSDEFELNEHTEATQEAIKKCFELMEKNNR